MAIRKGACQFCPGTRRILVVLKVARALTHSFPVHCQSFGSPVTFRIIIRYMQTSLLRGVHRRYLTDHKASNYNNFLTSK
jgi:hypothetical protein